MIKLGRNEIEMDKIHTGWRIQEDDGVKLGLTEVGLEEKGVWNWDWWLGEGNSAAVLCLLFKWRWDFETNGLFFSFFCFWN